MSLIYSILAGSFAGLAAALCGVGGGIVMVPVFVHLLGLGQKEAVATSLAAIGLTAVVTSFKNHGNGFIDWNIAIPAALASVVVAWFAADTLKKLSNQTLQVIFAVLLVAVGLHMLYTALRPTA